MRVTCLGLLSIFAAIGGTISTGEYTVPPDLPDCHYATNGALNAQTGALTYVYLGPLVETSIHVGNIHKEIAGLVRRDTVNCNGRSAGNSVSITQDALADYFNGWDTSPYTSFWSTAGSSRA
jgi:hypothetical protein